MTEPTGPTGPTEPTEPTEPIGRTEELSYEQARDELVEVVRSLEQGGTTLAESLALWERGEELARICQEALEGARERLEAALSQERAETDPDAG